MESYHSQSARVLAYSGRDEHGDLGRLSVDEHGWSRLQIA